MDEILKYQHCIQINKDQYNWFLNKTSSLTLLILFTSKLTWDTKDL